MFELKLKQGNLLGEAVSPLMILGEVALIECSPEPDGFLLQTTDITNLFFAEIRVHRGNFIRFFVDDLYMVAANLTEFHSILSTTNDEEDLTITYHHEHNSDFLRCTFEDTTGVHPVRDKDLDLFDYPCKQVNWDTSQLNFEVVVGIPSPDFRRIYESLSEFGDTVHISVTAELVTFTTEPMQVVLAKENGSCIIAGAGDTPVCFVIILQHMETYLETSYMWASLLSDTIWMLWSHDGCAQLNFPFWPLGNIMYYYIQG